jgi:hypothetical membrane protein
VFAVVRVSPDVRDGERPMTASSVGSVNRMDRERLLGAAIACVVPYGLGDLASGLLYEGYSFRDQWISELTAFGSPVRPLMVTAILVHGLLLIAFAVGLWRSPIARVCSGSACCSSWLV